MARNQKFEGNVPTGDEWWAAKTLPLGGGQWILFVRGKPSEGWINTKLVFDGERHWKANFWLSYNFDKGRFAATNDSRLLEREQQYINLRRQYLEAIHDLA